MITMCNFWDWLAENTSENKTFQNAIRLNPKDMTVRGVYADYLEENQLSNKDSLNFLRFDNKPVIFQNIANKIYAYYCYTMNEIKDITAGANHHFFSPSTIRHFKSRNSNEVFCGPGGVYFITSDSQLDSPRDYRVRRFRKTYDANVIEISGESSKVYNNLRDAKKVAAVLAQTPE